MEARIPVEAYRELYHGFYGNPKHLNKFMDVVQQYEEEFEKRKSIMDKLSMPLDILRIKDGERERLIAKIPNTTNAYEFVELSEESVSKDLHYLLAPDGSEASLTIRLFKDRDTWITEPLVALQYNRQRHKKEKIKEYSWDDKHYIRAGHRPIHTDSRYAVFGNNRVYRLVNGDFATAFMLMNNLNETPTSKNWKEFIGSLFVARDANKVEEEQLIAMIDDALKDV